LLEDRSPLVRAAAAETLERSFWDEDRAALIKALGQDRSPQVRAAAAGSLDETYSEAADKALLKATQDGNAQVREAAAKALRGHNGPVARQFLEKQRRQELERVRRQLAPGS